MKRSTWMTTTMMTAMLAIGCAKPKPEMARFDVDVKYDAALLARGSDVPSATVQLVGLTADEKEAWSNYEMNNYLQPSDPYQSQKRDAGLIKTFNLSAANQGGGRLAKTDPLWNAWKGSNVLYMAILSSYPRQASAVKPDPRRQIVPLDRAAWDGRTIGVTIGESGVRYAPLPKPVE